MNIHPLLKSRALLLKAGAIGQLAQVYLPRGCDSEGARQTLLPRRRELHCLELTVPKISPSSPHCASTP